jgi:diacylglycerol kinase family enzyme
MKNRRINMDADKIAENKKMIIEGLGVSIEGLNQLAEQYEVAKRNLDAVAIQLREASRVLTEML